MGTGRNLHYYWSRFQPHRLTAARELRGMTKRALAEKIGKSSSALTQFESGINGIDIQTFTDIVSVLELPAAFFAVQQGYELELGSCHFRARRGVSQTTRRQAIAYANRVLNIFWTLEEMGVDFPKADLPCMNEPSREGGLPEIEAAAVQTRTFWGLGLGPIDNMAQLLESKGVFIIFLPDEYAGIDALSDWVTDERPCILAVGNSQPSRLQFDYGHELAHLLFHRDIPTGMSETERVANAFSGAFLMPAATFGKYAPAIWHYRSFLDTKEEWFVSIQAAMYRARELGKLSDRAHRNGIFFLRNKGWSTCEPGEFAPPYPSMLAEALELVSGELTLPELAEDVGLREEELEDILCVQRVPQKVINRMKPCPVRRKHLTFTPKKHEALQ